MRRKFKNIRHKKAVREFLIPIDKNYALRILAGSRAEAEKIALQLAVNCADKIIGSCTGPAKPCREDRAPRVSFS